MRVIYVVPYINGSGDPNRPVFALCHAEGPARAMDLVGNAAPDVKVLGAYTIGDYIHWSDPGAGKCDGIYRIAGIRTIEGAQAGTGSVMLLLRNSRGSEIEACLNEIGSWVPPSRMVDEDRITKP